MKGALIILAITVVTGIILYILDRRTRRDSDGVTSSVPDLNPAETENKEQKITAETDEAANSECCGLHLVCEKELSAIADNRILYYDDEELDRYVGRAPGSYTPEETEEFRDVLMTLLPHDIPGWARSLDRRGIHPPQEIRDELLIMLQDIA